MPVSHIGLTVSHLPTSCSFFLAALTPLGYRYIGHFDGQIGFGVDEPEFFISQETTTVKAGAAHIAFHAPSRRSVDAFFVAALKAGGRIHGEPAERDSASKYYSAAVLDVDDNSIEVMHRPEAPAASRLDCGSEASRVDSWQKEVANTTVGLDAQSERPKPQTVLTNIMKPTIMVATPSNDSNSGNDANSRTFIGTLLGAAAGAAIAYAMTKGEENGNKTAGSVAYQVVEAARSHLAPAADEQQRSCPQSFVSRQEPHTLDYARSQVSGSQSIASYGAPSSHQPSNRLTIAAPPPPHASTLIDTFVQPSEVPRYRRHSVSRSQTDGAIPSSKHSRASSHLSSRGKPSRASSAGKTVTQADLTPSQRSSVVTEIRHPRDMPLPDSKATSITSKLGSDLRRMVLDPERNEDTGTVLGSVAPSDSVSQAGSKRSRGSRRSSRHSSRSGSHHRDEEKSHVSEATIKAEKSRSGSRRPSIMSLPVKASSKTSVHRSVVSFLPGM